MRFFIYRLVWKCKFNSIGITSEKLHTCDISSKNIENAKKFTSDLSNFIDFYTQDSLVFLKEFNESIDLLYLDSLDGHDPIAASNHQLNEAKISLRKLHKKSLILLDDKGSKTNFSINFYKNNGFKIIYETEYQVLLSQWSIVLNKY